jgi:hypothetical protein
MVYISPWKLTQRELDNSTFGPLMDKRLMSELLNSSDPRELSPYGTKGDNFDEDYDISGASSHTATDIEHGLGYTTSGRPRSGEPKISFTPATNDKNQD